MVDRYSPLRKLLYSTSDSVVHGYPGNFLTSNYKELSIFRHHYFGRWAYLSQPFSAIGLTAASRNKKAKISQYDAPPHALM
jgi:hypothetical protein